MRQPAELALVRRWPLIAACVLVFLFAFHAKTEVYKQGLRRAPHTATSSKMWLKIQRIPKPSSPSYLANSPSFKSTCPVAGRVMLLTQLASGFVPVLCFRGLSPLTI